MERQSGAAGPARTTGVAGLGTTGRVIAERLAAVGQVRVYDEAPDRREDAASAGLVAVGSLEALARACNTVVLRLPDAAAVESAVRALAPAAPGLVLVDTSALAPEDSALISTLALSEGSLYLDVPVVAPPEQVGEWRLELGGPASTHALVSGLFAPLAAEVTHVGAVGSPAR